MLHTGQDNHEASGNKRNVFDGESQLDMEVKRIESQDRRGYEAWLERQSGGSYVVRQM